MKSKHEIDELKRSWEVDPCWDIEDTEGFEDHYDELILFRLVKEAEWDCIDASEAGDIPIPIYRKIKTLETTMKTDMNELEAIIAETGMSYNKASDFMTLMKEFIESGIVLRELKNEYNK